MYNKIRQTSPDKIRGKLVKYKLGDCFSIKHKRQFIGAVMTGKFNKYYNLTFMEFRLSKQPTIEDFMNGRLFGTRFGSWEDLQYGVDQMMLECKHIDNEPNIVKVGELKLIPDFKTAGYAYLNDIPEIFDYYTEEIEVRIKKSNDAAKFPNIAFVGKHLLETKNLIEP